MARISITAADAGTVIASGDGTLTALALIDAGQPEPWSLLALTDGNGYAPAWRKPRGVYARPRRFIEHAALMWFQPPPCGAGILRASSSAAIAR